MPPARQPGDNSKNREAKMHTYPLRSPRFWHGMRFGPWLRLLIENKFRVHPLRVPMVCLISMFTPFNSVMSRLQRWRHGQKVDQTLVTHPPLFIIGHWRSGTTYLHELLALDDRFICPTTYQCFAPEHFLVTEWIFARYFGFILPKRRPMDDVQAGWLRPQEDEFALLTMGARSPYRRMAFPNRGPVDMQYLDMAGIEPADLERWSSTLLHFVKAMTYQDPKRVILKSPTHTGRVRLLSEIFPGAQFIHITRHPYSLFPSTRRLWKSLDQVQGCQIPHHRDLDAYVFEAFDRMYGGFHQQRDQLDPQAVYDIRYEDLVTDPVGNLERIYQRLDLGAFDHVRPALEAYAEQQKSYQANRYDLEPEVRAQVRRRWSEYFERYGYQEEA